MAIQQNLPCQRPVSLRNDDVAYPLRPRVKVCGITRPEDGQACAALGADAIGLVFYPPSPRAVTVAQAQAVVAALPPFVTVVALFVDPTVEEVNHVLEAVPIDVLQFHGDESAAFCRQFHRPYLKAVRVQAGLNLLHYASLYPDARALLTDAYQPGVPGERDIALIGLYFLNRCRCR